MTVSPNGSLTQEDTEEEKAEKAKAAAKKEEELKEKKMKEAAYINARDKAIALQGEPQQLAAKTKAMNEAANKAREAAKQLRIAMGSGTDIEADMAADELGIKQGDAGNATEGAAAAGGNSSAAANGTAGAKPGSGVSVVSFAVPTSEDADILVSKLFRQQLIADVQIMTSNTRRLYMRYKKMMETDNIVKLKLVTSDGRVPALIRFLIQNNPTSSKDEVVPEIIAQQMNSGSKEYTEWVKNQTKQQFSTENGDKLNDVINDLESAVAESKEKKPDDEEATFLEETNGEVKVEKREPEANKEKANKEVKADKKVEKK